MDKIWWFLLLKDEMVHQYKQVSTCKPLSLPHSYEELEEKGQLEEKKVTEVANKAGSVRCYHSQPALSLSL